MNAVTAGAISIPSGTGLVAGDGTDIALAARGDIHAFERVYRRHVEHIDRLARRIVGADDAEDATQDVFIRVWQKAATYRGESQFRTWIHSLAINILIRRAAQRQRNAQRFVHEDVSSHASRDESSDPRLDVETALGTLSPELRAVVVLHDMEGYSHAEIGEIIGISVSAARMRLHRARAALRAFASAEEGRR